MPVSTVETAPGVRVFDFRCECGEQAIYGRDVHLREALRTGDVSRAGKWTCGPDGCRKAKEKAE